MERRLGKGLGSLLGGTSAMSEEPQGTHEVQVDEIHPNPEQPRKSFDSEELDELRDSIRRHGVLQPICVRRNREGYEIISGERRWRSARLAGLKTIPVIVRENVSDEEMMELAMVENLQRADLDALEKAHGFQAMMDRLSLTQEQVAEKVGLRRSTVANHLRILELPDSIRDALVRNLITMGHARALLGLPNEKAMLTMLSMIVREDLSVRQAEKLVRESQPRRSSAAAAPQTDTVVPVAPWINELQHRFRESLGTRVMVRNSEGYRGQIVIQYHDRQELDRLCEVLAPREELR